MRREEMEEKEESRNGDYWLWGAAAASTVQLGWGISVVRRGYAGDVYHMPFKAAGVGTLFAGAVVSAFIATLRVSGIHSVKDAKTLGSNIRSALGLRSQAGDE